MQKRLPFYFAAYFCFILRVRLYVLEHLDTNENIKTMIIVLLYFNSI